MVVTLGREHSFITTQRYAWHTRIRYDRRNSLNGPILRDGYTTLLLSIGMNLKIVGERLDHTSIVLTLDPYSHVLPNMQPSADELEKILFENFGTPKEKATEKPPVIY
jgi:integrase